MECKRACMERSVGRIQYPAAQGIVGSIPWTALVFFTLYLQLLGMSDFAASVLMALFLGSTGQPSPVPQVIKRLQHLNHIDNRASPCSTWGPPGWLCGRSGCQTTPASWADCSVPIQRRHRHPLLFAHIEGLAQHAIV
jgi:hypothetical protein